MRYDEDVTFVKEGKPVYDYSTGDYIPSEPIKDFKKANVSDVNGDIKNMLFGSLNQSAKVVRLKNSYKKPFDRVMIDEKPYTLSMPPKYHRHETVFYVGGSQ